MAGVEDKPRVLVCIDGAGFLDHDGKIYSVDKGDVVLLPAIVGSCLFWPDGDIPLFEISLPDSDK